MHYRGRGARTIYSLNPIKAFHTGATVFNDVVVRLLGLTSDKHFIFH